MRRLLIILFCLFSVSLNAATYYVKNGGNDSSNGLSDGNAWETITKVNTSSFSPGDNILFKKGDTFIGTLTPPSSGTSENYITFGAYGTGDDPTITPTAVIDGLIWTVHSGSIYKTTDIPFNPGNMLIDGKTKIPKINDANFTTAYNSSFYEGLNSLALLALVDGYTFSINGQNVNFWDGLDALYAYNSATGTTYIRFRGGDNPNSKSLSISDEGSKAVYISAKRYITIQNLHLLGGEYGIDYVSVNYSGYDNVIVENCTIESSNVKNYIHSGSRGITIRNNTITNSYLSPYSPGAWSSGTEYIHGVHRHIYEFGKYRIGTGSSETADSGTYLIGGPRDNILVYGNTIIGCICGISLFGANSSAYNNYIEGTSSVGIVISYASENSSAHDNYIVNSNIPFRFQYVDNITYPNRINYVYRNKVYIPDAGEFIYVHYGTTGPSVATVFIYHNSVICKRGVYVSTYARDYPTDGTGFVFVNNIISSSGTCVDGYSQMVSQADFFKWDYNLVSGYYYSKTAAVWAPVPNNIYHLSTFWDHSTNPPDFTDIAGTEVINAGIDVSRAFTLDGVNYPALPGISSSDYLYSPDIGAFEYGEIIPPESHGQIFNNDKKVFMNGKQIIK